MRFAVVLFALSLVSPAQQPVPPAVPSPPQPVEMLAHWRRATVALGQVVTMGNKQTFVTNGSAVIVAVDANHACLLTAKHMFFNPNEGYLPTQISMRLPRDSAGGDEDMGVVIPLVINGKNLWKTTMENSDLAVVALPNLQKYKNVHAVGLQDFGIAGDVFQGAAIMVLGYPGILGETYQTTPIARGGLVAWTNPEDLPKKPFLVDANIFGGNSGGPVFRVRSGFDKFGNMNIGGGYAFIGIVSEDAQEYSDVVITDGATYATKMGVPNPITQRPDHVLAQVKNIGGIGVVEPVALIKELLEDAFGKPRGFFSDPANMPKFPPNSN
jgi:hypothetical protein